jgi:hypothetical protein
MTTFKEIRGQLIRSVSSDPANPQVGEIWYNNTIGVLKGYKTISAVWVSGGNLTTGRNQHAGAGTQTAAITYMGVQPATPTAFGTLTEEYNGSSWTAGGNSSTGRHATASAGTQTAALGAGGYTGPPVFYGNQTEEYDGSAWTGGGNLNTGRYTVSGFGVQTAAVAVGGNIGGLTDATEEYDGSAWTAGTAFPSTISTAGSDGTLTSGLIFAGSPAPRVATFAYDGTSWTAGGNMNTYRSQMGSGSAGSSSSSIGIGGLVPPSTRVGTTELYDGSTWATSASTALLSNEGAGAGTNTAALYFSGNIGGGVSPTATEEFTGAFNATQTLTTS